MLLCNYAIMILLLSSGAVLCMSKQKLITRGVRNHHSPPETLSSLRAPLFAALTRLCQSLHIVRTEKTGKTRFDKSLKNVRESLYRQPRLMSSTHCLLQRHCFSSFFGSLFNASTVKRLARLIRRCYRLHSFRVHVAPLESLPSKVHGDLEYPLIEGLKCGIVLWPHRGNQEMPLTGWRGQYIQRERESAVSIHIKRILPGGEGDLSW
jgi:hypothetical protein